VPALGSSGYLSVAAAPSPSTVARKPVLIFLWAQGCGDCAAQAPSLTRVWHKYKSQGLQLITVTRLYGTVDDKPATPDEEKARIEQLWSKLYAGLDGVPALVDTETMVRFGASATPTFVLVDRKGLVRMYTPTRLSEWQLSRRIEEVLAETP
jgi:thiol-disulfide isomerase/thioredoxin